MTGSARPDDRLRRNPPFPLIAHVMAGYAFASGAVALKPAPDNKAAYLTPLGGGVSQLGETGFDFLFADPAQNILPCARVAMMIVGNPKFLLKARNNRRQMFACDLPIGPTESHSSKLPIWISARLLCLGLHNHPDETFAAWHRFHGFRDCYFEFCRGYPSRVVLPPPHLRWWWSSRLLDRTWRVLSNEL